MSSCLKIYGKEVMSLPQGHTACQEQSWLLSPAISVCAQGWRSRGITPPSAGWKSPEIVLWPEKNAS